MSLKRLYIVLLGIQFILVAVLMVVTLNIFQNQNNLHKSQRTRLNSFLLADELRQSSDDLTHMARAYVVTGNAEFKRDYQTILGIRNGKIPRPASYNRIYWDFELATGQKPRSDGEAISLHDLIIKEGLTHNETEKLNLALRYSNKLVKTEMTAMNAVNGLFDGGSGNYTIKKKHDREMAIKILFDEEYHKAKAGIMKPIDDFYVMLEKRTTTEVSKYEQRSTYLLWASLILIIIIMGMFLISFFAIERQITKRILSEEELRKQEKRFRSLYENSTIGLYRSTPDGKIILANPAIIKMLGYSSFAELADRNLEENGFEPNYERKKFLEQVEMNGEIMDFESAWTRKDGTAVYIRESAKVVHNSSGKTLYYDGTAEEITERKLSENKLIASEIRYRRLFESAKDGILILDAETGKIVDVNPFLINLLGYSKEQFLEKEIWEIGFFRDIVANKEKFLELQEKEYVRYKDLPLETSIGRKIHVEFVSNVYLADKLKVIQCNIRDITERKLAEDEVRKLSRGVQQSPASIIITDIKGNIEYVNPKLTEITGYQLSDLVGRNPRIFSSGEKPKSEYKILWHTISSGNEWNGELHNKKKNGELYWENALISPIKNENGEITNFIAIKEDITERKKMVEELTLALDKAEEMNRIKSSFFANMSHELRTPLIGINGFSEFLVESLKDPELKEMAENILISGQRLSETLNLILDITKSESNKMGYKLEPVELVGETEKLINSFREAAHKKEIMFTTSYSSKAIYLNIDRRAYRTVMNNLINNAVKFTHDGEITICITPKDKYIEIKVIDTGIGIAKTDQELIFEEFRQASEGFERNFEGTGLGLSITKKIVEKFGGSIIVESELGKGSTFRLKLPYAENGEKIEKISKEVIIDDKLTKTISEKPIALLVDDDPFVQSVLKKYLSEIVELDSALAAKSAIKMLENKKYNIILMDINLKRGLDGVQATKEMRKMKGYESIPIIAITAYALDGDREEFISAGCTHYLPKPFTKQEILILMDDVLASITTC